MMLKESLSIQTVALVFAVMFLSTLFCSATKASLMYTFTFIAVCRYSILTVFENMGYVNKLHICSFI